MSQQNSISAPVQKVIWLNGQVVSVQVRGKLLWFGALQDFVDDCAIGFAFVSGSKVHWAGLVDVVFVISKFIEGAVLSVFNVLYSVPSIQTSTFTFF